MHGKTAGVSGGGRDGIHCSLPDQQMFGRYLRRRDSSACASGQTRTWGAMVLSCWDHFYFDRMDLVTRP